MLYEYHDWHQAGGGGEGGRLPRVQRHGVQVPELRNLVVAG